MLIDPGCISAYSSRKYYTAKRGVGYSVFEVLEHAISINSKLREFADGSTFWTWGKKMMWELAPIPL